MKKVIIFSLFWLSVIFNLFVAILFIHELIFLKSYQMPWGCCGWSYQSQLHYSIFWGCWIIILLLPTLYALYKKYKKHSKALIFTLIPTILFLLRLAINYIFFYNI